MPERLIAQSPPDRREDARLLVVDRSTDGLSDRGIVDLPGLLRGGDLLVLNDTKVLPARFTVRRKTGGMVGGLFLEEEQRGVWIVLFEKSGRLRTGETLGASGAAGTIPIHLLSRMEEGRWRVRVDAEGTAAEVLEGLGQTPLPPYIKRRAAERSTDEVDRERYQTVYARSSGAVAAPTAGLHFTPRLLESLRESGVETAFVTLHVGPGTFRPVSVDDLSRHVMHSEWFNFPGETADAVNACRRRGGLVVAVGTTTVRVLETVAAACPSTPAPASQAEGHGVGLTPMRGETRLLVYPPFEFRVVDALLTNFHLSRSTLLALVMAFAGMERTRRAYAHAIERHYRFYSYGDAMLIA